MVYFKISFNEPAKLQNITQLNNIPWSPKDFMIHYFDHARVYVEQIHKGKRALYDAFDLNRLYLVTSFYQKIDF